MRFGWKYFPLIFLVPMFFSFAASAGFPKELPQKRPCIAEDINGLHKLRLVWEYPEGEYTQEREDAPHSYMRFFENTQFSQVSGKRYYENEDQLEPELMLDMNQSKGQYLLSEQGIMYFYRDGSHVDTYYCFVATLAEEGVQKGDILLQKSLPGISSQVIKVYQPYNFEDIKKKAAAAERKRQNALRQKRLKEERLKKMRSAVDKEPKKVDPKRMKRQLKAKGRAVPN